MSLSGVLSTARFALESAAAQTALVSRNIAGAGDASYTRKTSEPVAYLPGLNQPQVRRAESQFLAGNSVSARADAAGAKALSEGVTALRNLLGSDATSGLNASINGFKSGLAAAASDPSDPLLARRAVDGAKTLAGSISTAAQGLGDAAGRLSANLAAFEAINTRIVTGTRIGDDVTDLMDQRDKLVGSMSEIVGLSTRTRGDNDMVLQTDGGTILFETRARSVSYQSGSPVQPGQPGGRFLVDGVAIAGPNAAMPLQTGLVRGLVDLRDGPALQMEAQLDETARLLINAFAETPNTSGLPDIPGLFTATGLATLPSSPARVPGLASSLQINANVDPAQGGNMTLLRDGGIGAPGNPAYRANTTNASGFPDRLIAIGAALDTSLAADASAGLGAQRSFSDFSARMFGSVEENRKVAEERSAFSGIVAERAVAAHATATGVSLDAEMTRLLELERSYAASAKIMSVVDQMHDALFAAVR
jgi:flagellar hook-associated protein 1